MELQVGDIISERYELRQFVSEGHLRSVWRGYDLILNRDVAIKLFAKGIRSVGGIDLSDAYNHEAQIVARVEHPHILPIYDFGEYLDYVYSVIRLMPEGSQTLLNYATQTRVKPSIVLNIAQGIANAIDYLHEHGIVHGDLTDRNILLDPQINPYISNLVIHSMIVTAPGADLSGIRHQTYMSPEVVQGLSLEPCMDMFTLGLLLFTCFYGNRPPFTDSNGEEIAFARVLVEDETASLPLLSKARPNIPLGVDAVIRKLTHSNKNLRYKKASEALDDLNKAFFSGQSSITGKIFISHSSDDKDYVSQLADELRLIGLNIWIDEHGIKPGTTWAESIQDGLNSCDHMLLIVTDDSMKSDYVTYEWSYFMGRGKPVYPFIPGNQPEKMHPRLEHIQHINGTDDIMNDVFMIVDMLAGGISAGIDGEG